MIEIGFLVSAGMNIIIHRIPASVLADQILPIITEQYGNSWCITSTGDFAILPEFGAIIKIYGDTDHFAAATLSASSQTIAIFSFNAGQMALKWNQVISWKKVSQSI